MIYFCADDYGLSDISSKRILECIEKGALNKVSVFPNITQVDLKEDLENKDVRISLHLNLVEGKCMAKPEEIPLIAHKDGRQGSCQQQRRTCHSHSECAHDHDAFPEHVLQFRPVVGAMVIADDGRGADDKTDEHRNEDEIHIHDHAVGGNAVLPGISQELQVV